MTENDSVLLDQAMDSSCSEVVETHNVPIRKRERKMLSKSAKWTSEAVEKLTWGLLSHGNDWDSL